MTPLRTIAAITLACQATAFTPITPCNNIQCITSSRSTTTTLFSLIKGEAPDSEPMDENLGGVGLAKRCASKISGVSSKDKGSTPQEMLRYEKLTEVDVSTAKSILETSNSQLLCSGSGKEMYQDPGSSGRYEDKVIQLAPIEAASAALSSIASAVTIGEDTKSVVMNFLGGDDLIIGEVTQACDLLLEGLDFPSKTKVRFNSVSYTDVPSDVCSVTVVASGDKSGGLDGVDASLARGELYVDADGKWFTLTEGDITTE